LVRPRSTHADFDDDDDVVVTHEQIDLGATHMKVSREDRTSYVFKIVCRGIFRACAGLLSVTSGGGRSDASSRDRVGTIKRRSRSFSAA